jgi:secondary thiamine-phosphate synthase enzyme
MARTTDHVTVLPFTTAHRYQVMDITSRVAEAVTNTSMDCGICHIYVAHTTAAITINENADSNIGVDLVTALDRLIPEGTWQHDKIDDNGAAHIKAAIIGPSEVVPVRHGRLLLGTWQAIMLVEFDGPRDRYVMVTIQPISHTNGRGET